MRHDTASDSRQRLYFDHSDGTLLCVGVDGYAGAYYASDLMSLPTDFDPLGLPLARIAAAQREAAAARAEGFLARRRAARALAEL